MKTNKTVSVFMLALLFSCKAPLPPGNPESWKQELLETETAFSQMASDSGIGKAFEVFAAGDAVLMRNNKLVKGEAALQHYFNQAVFSDPKVKLEWEADFADVSKSGDLGYTYGKYIFTVIDSMGIAKRDTGIFHTVWKRQPDGQWRFVWD